MKYCNSLYHYTRLKTREVLVGNLPLGGQHPIRVQSMTTTDTMNTEATVAQSLRMVESGCEVVRITAPSKKEAENLAAIRDALRAAGCEVPLVADIHFTPNAAEIAARIVEKVRVNPGNYADKKKFDEIDYTDESYTAEILRIRERFRPLVKICKEEGTVLRIGTNHGSLSDRILSRYGDTPKGMVESALEFVRICEDNDFRDLVISMKASNPQIMVYAYRMLVNEMLERGECYPLHLGVTEAGEGEDGRIKSALGIAALLLDGLGDTVRVSLTEDPEFESPVARFIVNFVVEKAEESGVGGPKENKLTETLSQEGTESSRDPFVFERRENQTVLNLGKDQVPRVFADTGGKPVTREFLAAAGYTYLPVSDKYNIAEMAADFIYLGSHVPVFDLPGGLKKVYHHKTWDLLKNKTEVYPLYESFPDWEKSESHSAKLNFVVLDETALETLLNTVQVYKEYPGLEKVVFLLDSTGRFSLYRWRALIHAMMHNGLTNPVVLRTRVPDAYPFYKDEHLPVRYRLPKSSMDQLYLAAQMSAMVIDGLIDGIWVENSNDLSNRTCFGLFQATRQRITKTEYISCPSCGRTLFDLQETTAMIRKKTEHLKGVKIGIMGCIVNGPGEMADADFGYVGVGIDKIALYRGKEVVEKGVKTDLAVDKLIELIKSEGMWIDPPQ